MKIAIVGGGAAGLTAAWLLEGTHDVVLYEKQSRLGGHAETIIHDEMIVETGFEFFSSELFPTFINLLKLLHVPINQFSCTYTLYCTNNDDCMMLPPFHDGIIDYKDFSPSNLAVLIEFKQFVAKGKSIVKDCKTDITIEDYVNSLEVSESFKNDFLYPFLSSGWGVPFDIFKKLAAYDILSWYIKMKPARFFEMPLYEVVGGNKVYVDALTNDLKNTIVHKSTLVHILKQNDCYLIFDNRGNHEIFDHLIIATNGHDAAQLLVNIEEAESVRTHLAQLEYWDAMIAVHSDESYLPSDKAFWATVNIDNDGVQSAMTIYKRWRSKVPVFRSWITPSRQDTLPKNLIEIRYYKHALVTPSYFAIQHYLKEVQGRHNLWLAGVYMHDIDSHESAIMSAVSIAERLAPISKRLMTLLKK